jgi:peroxiredoxin
MRLFALLPLLFGVAACAPKEQKEKGTPGPAARVQLAPELHGTLADGSKFALEELHGDGVVLVFYRSAYCGLCRRRLIALAAHRKAYADLGMQLVAITNDPPALARWAAEQFKLDFPVVSTDRATFARWGLWPQEARAPYPAAFILGREGEVRFSHVGRAASERDSDASLLFTLRSLAATPLPASSR